jgi:hypothetical protein
MSVTKAQGINGTLFVGDIVFSAPQGNEYGLLVGRITEIIPHGSPEHDTGNPSDDIHVDFLISSYSDERENEIAAAFSAVYGEPKSFDDLPLDDVIMPPDSLVHINHIDSWSREKIMSSREEAEAYFENHYSESRNDLMAELVERIEKSYMDYNASLLKLGKQELIDMSGKIHAMSDAHSYLTVYYDFSKEEAEFFLQFQNPLEIVADKWREHNNDLDEMSITMDYINGHNDEFYYDYPLTSDAKVPVDISPHRYMGVDITNLLHNTSEKIVTEHSSAWRDAEKVLREAAKAHDSDKNRMVWRINSHGIHIEAERDVFLKDSNSYKCMLDFHKDESNIHGYVVEMLVMSGQMVIGNVFEIGDYIDYAKHISDIAEPIESISLVYSDKHDNDENKIINVSRDNYNNALYWLNNGNGILKETVIHPENKVRLASLLVNERSKQMKYPVGNPQLHLRRLSEKLVASQSPNKETEQSTSKPPKTLQEKMQAASKKVKAQKQKLNNKKPRKRDERS